MEEMSPAVAMTLSLGNSMCDSSGISTHVEIARRKLVTDTVSLLSDPEDFAALSASKDAGVGGTDSLKILPENGTISVPSDVIQESDEDEVLSVVEDNNGIMSEELLALEAGSEINLPKSVGIEDSQIIAKAIIVESSNEVQVPTAKLLIAAVNPNADISDGSDLRASAVVLKLPSEKNLSKGTTRSVFEIDCIPLWGSVSICGRRPEMEDAVAAVPRFAKIPINMLIGDRVVDGLSESLTHITSHFFGVYDGHGGVQVHSSS